MKHWNTPKAGNHRKQSSTESRKAPKASKASQSMGIPPLTAVLSRRIKTISGSNTAGKEEWEVTEVTDKCNKSNTA